MFQMTFILIAYFDWLLGPQKWQIFEKKIFKNILRNCLLYEVDTLHSVTDFNSLVCFLLFSFSKYVKYVIFVIQMHASC